MQNPKTIGGIVGVVIVALISGGFYLLRNNLDLDFLDFMDSAATSVKQTDYYSAQMTKEKDPNDKNKVVFKLTISAKKDIWLGYCQARLYKKGKANTEFALNEETIKIPVGKTYELSGYFLPSLAIPSVRATTTTKIYYRELDVNSDNWDPDETLIMQLNL